MHAAWRAFLCVRGDVGLGDPGLEPMVAELVLAEGAREEASLVRLAVEIDDEDVFKLCFGEDHGSRPV